MVDLTPFRALPVAALPVLLAMLAAPSAAQTDGTQQSGRIDIFKPDGSRQCEPDSGIPIDAMQRELTEAGVDVHAASTAADGMLRPQVCGAPTGQIHVFTIDAAAAQAAADLGFLPAAALTMPGMPNAPTSP